MSRDRMAFLLLTIGAILLVYPKIKSMIEMRSVGTLDAPTVGSLMTAAGLVLSYSKIRNAIV